jgi:hypothetical protein
VRESRVEKKITSQGDHINELGFANDGYDYSQHLRTIGNSVSHPIVLL